MILRGLALFVLLVFVAGFVSPTVGELLHLGEDSVEAAHSTGTPCPHPEDGHPCGPACACTCCPGHVVAVPVVAPPLPRSTQLSDDLKVFTRQCLHPKDFHYRIFHPPRA
jgi:hypothetical protein